MEKNSVDFNLITAVKSGDMTAKNDLYNKYKPLMNKMAKKCKLTAEKAHVNFDYYDYIQEQYIGFERAINNVDISRIMQKGNKSATPETWTFYQCLWGYIQVTNRDFIKRLIKDNVHTTSSNVEVGEDSLDLGDYASYKKYGTADSPEEEFFKKQSQIVFQKSMDLMMENMNKTQKAIWNLKIQGYKPAAIREEMNISQKEYSVSMREIKQMWNTFSKKISQDLHVDNMFSR